MGTIAAIIIYPSRRAETTGLHATRDTFEQITGGPTMTIRPETDRWGGAAWMALVIEGGDLAENPRATDFAESLGWSRVHKLVGPVVFIGELPDGTPDNVPGELMARLNR